MTAAQIEMQTYLSIVEKVTKTSLVKFDESVLADQRFRSHFMRSATARIDMVYEGLLLDQLIKKSASNANISATNEPEQRAVVRLGQLDDSRPVIEQVQSEQGPTNQPVAQPEQPMQSGANDSLNLSMLDNFNPTLLCSDYTILSGDQMLDLTMFLDENNTNIDGVNASSGLMANNHPPVVSETDGHTSKAMSNDGQIDGSLRNGNDSKANDRDETLGEAIVPQTIAMDDESGERNGEDENPTENEVELAAQDVGIIDLTEEEHEPSTLNQNEEGPNGDNNDTNEVSIQRSKRKQSSDSVPDQQLIKKPKFHNEIGLIRRKRDGKFHCEECEFMTVHTGSIKSHYRMHRGEKPFDCEFCGRAFSHKSNGHKRIHEMAFNFLCNNCCRRFESENKLHSHQMGCKLSLKGQFNFRIVLKKVDE